MPVCERFREPAANTVPITSGHGPNSGAEAGAWTEVVRLASDAAVYGGGESYQGPNLRGRSLHMRNTEVNRAAGRNSAYLNVPLLWSDAGWGLLINTGAPVTADIGATHSEAMSVEVVGDQLDMLILLGDARTILRRYHELTGLPRRLPDWAFGVWMSRSSYFTADEMVTVADDLAAAECPVDVMHTDEWLEDVVLDTSAWSSEPDRRRYPLGWADALGRRGIRTSVWINPYIAPNRHAASPRRLPVPKAVAAVHRRGGAGRGGRRCAHHAPDDAGLSGRSCRTRCRSAVPLRARPTRRAGAGTWRRPASLGPTGPLAARMRTCAGDRSVMGSVRCEMEQFPVWRKS
jgi:alpha-glucosidase (family GH31 glycosyl hydrolase)